MWTNLKKTFVRATLYLHGGRKILELRSADLRRGNNLSFG